MNAIPSDPTPGGPAPGNSAPLTRTRAHEPSPWLIAGIDFVFVLLFVGLGRTTHDSSGFAGFVGTAYPFVIALAAAWIVLLWLTSHLMSDVWPAGLGIWIVTAAGGLGIRAFGGGTVTGGFPWVTLGVLFAFLVGWRFIYWLIRRRRAAA